MGLQANPCSFGRSGIHVMAIYSLHHQPIGKTTQARPHTAAAHVRYITRPSAMSRLEAARMPSKAGQAAAFMREGEDRDRKNARVADKMMLALPRELDADQRAQLVRAFAEDVTQGRAPWLAAFHDKGKDAQNPHAHLIVRDRDENTGRRVAGLSENGSTERLRSLWEGHANSALEKAGRGERIDRRTLEAQGIERSPTIHEGPKAQQMDKRGVQPESQIRIRRNAPGARSAERQVNYQAIDGGRSRPEYNRQVGRGETPADYWAAIDGAKRADELDQLRRIHHPPASVDILTGRGRVPPSVEQASRDARFTRRRLPGAALRPGTLQVGVLGPSGQQPAADRVAGVPGHGAGAEGLGAAGKPVPQALKGPGEPRNKNFHDKIIHQQLPVEKEKSMSVDEKDRKRREEELANASAAESKSRRLFGDAMGKSYMDPERAYGKMKKYKRRHGEKALDDKLADSNTNRFGRRPGSLLSRGFFEPGAKEKREASHDARPTLPRLMKDYHRDGERKRGAQMAYDELNPSSAPTGGGGGGGGRAPRPSADQQPVARPKVPAPERAVEAPQLREPARAPRERAFSVRPSAKALKTPLPKDIEYQRRQPEAPAKPPAQEPAIKSANTPDKGRSIMEQLKQKRERERALDKQKGKGMGE